MADIMSQQEKALVRKTRQRKGGWGGRIKQEEFAAHFVGKTGRATCTLIQYYLFQSHVQQSELLLICMVTHIARVWINRVRLPVLHVVS